ncbi:hypothetical protein BN1708_018128, partial [Verticillium longisporum]
CPRPLRQDRPQDRRELPCSCHWREGLWLRGI